MSAGNSSKEFRYDWRRELALIARELGSKEFFWDERRKKHVCKPIKKIK